MSIVRWDPFREFVGLQERMNRMVNELARRGEDEVLTRGDWIPPVDIYENSAGELIITAELPGIKREEIDVRVENNTLTIRGERKHASDVKDDRYHRIERVYGSFSRSFSLPGSIDTAKVSADHKDGLLSVKLPLRQEAKPRQVQVAVH